MTMSKALLKARRTSVLAAALIVGACADLDIQNTNAPTVETLTGSPTRSAPACAPGTMRTGWGARRRVGPAMIAPVPGQPVGWPMTLGAGSGRAGPLGRHAQTFAA